MKNHRYATTASMLLVKTKRVAMVTASLPEAAAVVAFIIVVAFSDAVVSLSTTIIYK